MAVEQTISSFDLHLMGEGTHRRLYERLGAHPVREGAQSGTRFAVWAPNAKSVSVIGDFNHWDSSAHQMKLIGEQGIWELFVPGVKKGSTYKYHISSKYNDYQVEKADPIAFHSELRPNTASKVWGLPDYSWSDQQWMETRGSRCSMDAPISVYELHLGSWMRNVEDGNRPLSYREVAPKLASYINYMGFTHVELLPIAEHPFDGSWGYQTLGLFAPTSRFGTPDDFAYFVEVLHQHDIGVILDWVPAHFPKDGHGLSYFDGTHLYEHADPRQGEHPDWGTLVYNYGRNEVRNFLLASALYWLDKFHIDGLRVDAVASMLYLDYSREDGAWVANEHGGRENLEALSFIKTFNEQVYEEFPGVMTIAEESTSWPGVSKPTYAGGLGFGYKWDMGWMNDTLKYFELDPIYRSHHQDKLTFRMLYANSENFMLSLSHDEVVHLKKSLISKMPGDDWQKAANLRLLFGNMYGQSGKKLLFMGSEFGQWDEWDFASSLDWHLLDEPLHLGIQRWVRDLNKLYRDETVLHQGDCHDGGFEWVDCSDNENCILSWLRKLPGSDEQLLFVLNMTPVVRHDYRIGVPEGGFWKEVLNSDAACYGGSGVGNMGGVNADNVPIHQRPCSLSLSLPPLGVLVMKS